MTLRIERDGAITTVILDRPEVRNAVDRQTADELLAAFTEFEADETARVAVLWGDNGIFCAGYDLKSLSEATPEDLVESDGEIGPLGCSRLLLSKPVIAAVEGYAVAGGLELALWCDMRVAAEDAAFGVFCRRWGVPLVDGGTIRLPRLIGMSRALDMILTGRPVSGQEALDFGLANRLVPAGGTRAAAESLARDLARFPQLCMRTDRASAYRQWDYDLAEALRREGAEGMRPIREEAVAGAARFAGGKGRGGGFDEI
ncbi:MAG: crotonase/enoyl-CoA hydratase family protein [Alphaproteobacteria bacterium]|jgi:enoyl-CoA hydratase|nr:crotonase/enoyl-CoA hydratase family protein [Alphaproteobacteria bacterium]MDP6564864.1 crotonase/enoyl-CoA hydratase family protein [Alphaproteobacteria bacterium]MDP6815309.1 crotonase/enoyl-CoA hydratase family protein [Alphaproteobacteria bacterium]